MSALHKSIRMSRLAAAVAIVGGLLTGAAQGRDLPKLQDVAKKYEKVVSTADDKPSLYTIWKREKDGQMLAELPGGFERQKLFIAYTIAGGVSTAGVQVGDMYVQWKRYDDRLALIQPNTSVRTHGDLESKKAHQRVFTDRVLLDIPIVARGTRGGPVIDLDALLVNGASNFFGGAVRGMNPRLLEIEKAKAFPKNLELAWTLPMRGGQLGTIYYSIRVIPSRGSYKPREADSRVGYFVTTYREIGDPSADDPWKRYVNRWHIEKAAPKLKLSPPKEPIVFYLEHTIPVRYRRWVREGVLEWNKAFEKIGITNAIEVYQQDARTGAHMDKDPEDARYNFILWTNAGMGFAIGPSRVHPETGQILDADVVMDEGFITSWFRAYEHLLPKLATEAMGPETLEWFRKNPSWDPRVRLAPPAERSEVKRQIAHAQYESGAYGGHPAASIDATLLGDDQYDGLAGRVSQVSGRCDELMLKSLDIAMFRLDPHLFVEMANAAPKDDDDDDTGENGENGDDGDDDNGEGDSDANGDEENGEADDEDNGEQDEDNGRTIDEKTDMLDGMPDWYIGPLLKQVVMHEVGHTLGLRHNFKASTVYTLEEINTEAHRGKPTTASVMDYNPVNINYENGPAQGDYASTTIGPYDYWAIEYGYTPRRNLKPILKKVGKNELIYATDEDTWGPDPRARRFDYGADPLNYAVTQMKLVQYLRTKILDRMVEEGESWAESRDAYELLLGRHFGAVSIAANWIGGAYTNRAKKGDPVDHDPIEMIAAAKQRRALNFVIENTFREQAFGLTPELLSKMTVDKWWSGGTGSIFADETWPVHDRILGLQASALSMIMNPTTLNRVYNNEYRIDPEEDALTVPDILYSISDEIWSELDEKDPTDDYASRRPMINSLRRNLQREHLQRLIDLTMPNDGFGPAAMPVSNLSMLKLRELDEQIDDVLREGRRSIDPYTKAHLTEAQVRIEKALEAQFIYNTDDIGGGTLTIPFFGQPNASENPKP